MEFDGKQYLLDSSGRFTRLMSPEEIKNPYDERQIRELAKFTINLITKDGYKPTLGTLLEKTAAEFSNTEELNELWRSYGHDEMMNEIVEETRQTRELLSILGISFSYSKEDGAEMYTKGQAPEIRLLSPKEEQEDFRLLEEYYPGFDDEIRAIFELAILEHAEKVKKGAYPLYEIKGATEDDMHWLWSDYDDKDPRVIMAFVIDRYLYGLVCRALSPEYDAEVACWVYAPGESDQSKLNRQAIKNARLKTVGYDLAELQDDYRRSLERLYK